MGSPGAFELIEAVIDPGSRVGWDERVTGEPADPVVCAQHAWLSPLPPEGASAIIHRTADRAPEMAHSRGVRSLDLLRDRIVDRVVAEHPDAADEPQASSNGSPACSGTS